MTEIEKKFCDKKKLQEFLTTKPTLQNILEGIPHMDEKYEHIHETMEAGGIKHIEEDFKRMKIRKVPNTPKQQNEAMNIYLNNNEC